MPNRRVSVIVLTRGNSDMLETCLESLAASEEPPGRVVVVEHETELAPRVVERFLAEKSIDLVCLSRKDGQDAPGETKKWSFSSLNNSGYAETPVTEPYLLLVNNDVILQPGTIKAMVEVLETEPEVGLVGPKLLFPDGTLQHVGVVFGQNGFPYHLGHKKPNDDSYEPGQRSDYYDALTFACVLIRKRVWEQLGGLGEEWHFYFDDVDFCLRARELKWKCFCTVQAVALHLEGSSRELMMSKEDQEDFIPLYEAGKIMHPNVRGLASNSMTFRKKWIDSGRLEKVFGYPLRAIGPTQMERVRVVMVPADKDAGISVWRILQPARKLMEKGLVNLEVLPPIGSNMERAARAFDVSEVVVWQAHFSEGVKRFAKMASLRPWVMLYEYDDHPLYLSPYASCYQGLGTQEQKIGTEGGEEHWLWRDGENGFDVERNRENRQRQMEIITLCDGLTTTTKPLAKFFERYNQKVWVLPNCIDFGAYRSLDPLYERRTDGPFRIAWWGGDNHWHDLSTIGKPLVRFVNAHEDVRMVFLGAFYRGPFKGINLDRVIQDDWVHAEAWPYRLANAGIDLAVIPLADPALPHMRFNHFKSEIKWLEASALKIPSLVQIGRAAYENCVDYENALTYDGEEEFHDKLSELRGNPDLRKRIGQAAYDWTREYRDLDKEIHRWAECYEEAKRLPRGAEELQPAASSAVGEGS